MELIRILTEGYKPVTASKLVFALSCAAFIMFCDSPWTVLPAVAAFAAYKRMKGCAKDEPLVE